MPPRRRARGNAAPVPEIIAISSDSDSEPEAQHPAPAPAPAINNNPPLVQNADAPARNLRRRGWNDARARRMEVVVEVPRMGRGERRDFEGVELALAGNVIGGGDGTAVAGPVRERTVRRARVASPEVEEEVVVQRGDASERRLAVARAAAEVQARAARQARANLDLAIDMPVRPVIARHVRPAAALDLDDHAVAARARIAERAAARYGRDRDFPGMREHLERLRQRLQVQPPAPRPEPGALVAALAAGRAPLLPELDFGRPPPPAGGAELQNRMGEMQRQAREAGERHAMAMARVRQLQDDRDAFIGAGALPGIPVGAVNGDAAVGGIGQDRGNFMDEAAFLEMFPNALDPVEPMVNGNAAANGAAAGAGPMLNGNRPEVDLTVEGVETVDENGAALLTVKDSDAIVALVLDLVPDLCPDHLNKLITTRVFSAKTRKISGSDACAEIVHILFENPAESYPKAEKNGKGKGKRRADEDAGPSNGSKKMKYRMELDEEEEDVVEGGKINFKSEKAGIVQRRGTEYKKRTTRDLENLFTFMTQKHIADILTFHNGLFVPTYIDLAFQHDLPEGERPWKAMQVARAQKAPFPIKKTKGKGKSKVKMETRMVAEFDVDGFEVYKETEVEIDDDGGEAIYKEEKDFLIAMLYEWSDANSVRALKILAPLEGDGDGECQCCFGDEHEEYMLQCDEGHQYCRECVVRLFEGAIGDQKAPVHCVHGDGCKAFFNDREIKKALTPKTANSYFALQQRKELEAAGIENLESCPFCEFAVVIDNENEKLFRCEHPECEIVSCRACKKPDHIPKSCAEAAQDNKLDQRHAVEEAMSQALIRKCPKCQKSFLKESGCNKITCHHCRTVSCYICRAEIKDGYSHFDQGPGYAPVPSTSGRSKKCRLWDPADVQDADRLYIEEVAEARRAAQDNALNQAQEAGQVLEAEDVNVALPEHGPGAPRRLDAMAAAMAIPAHWGLAPILAGGMFGRAAAPAPIAVAPIPRFGLVPARRQVAPPAAAPAVAPAAANRPGFFGLDGLDEDFGRGPIAIRDGGERARGNLQMLEARLQNYVNGGNVADRARRMQVQQILQRQVRVVPDGERMQWLHRMLDVIERQDAGRDQVEARNVARRRRVQQANAEAAQEIPNPQDGRDARVHFAGVAVRFADQPAPPADAARNNNAVPQQHNHNQVHPAIDNLRIDEERLIRGVLRAGEGLILQYQRRVQPGALPAQIGIGLDYRPVYNNLMAALWGRLDAQGRARVWPRLRDQQHRILALHAMIPRVRVAAAPQVAVQPPAPAPPRRQLLPRAAAGRARPEEAAAGPCPVRPARGQARPAPAMQQRPQPYPLPQDPRQLDLIRAHLQQARQIAEPGQPPRPPAVPLNLQGLARNGGGQAMVQALVRQRVQEQQQAQALEQQRMQAQARMEVLQAHQRMHALDRMQVALAQGAILAAGGRAAAVVPPAAAQRAAVVARPPPVARAVPAAEPAHVRERREARAVQLQLFQTFRDRVEAERVLHRGADRGDDHGYANMTEAVRRVLTTFTPEEQAQISRRIPPQLLAHLHAGRVRVGLGDEEIVEQLPAYEAEARPGELVGRELAEKIDEMIRVMMEERLAKEVVAPGEAQQADQPEAGPIPAALAEVEVEVPAENEPRTPGTPAPAYTELENVIQTVLSVQQELSEAQAQNQIEAHDNNGDENDLLPPPVPYAQNLDEAIEEAVRIAGRVMEMMPGWAGREVVAPVVDGDGDIIMADGEAEEGLVGDVVGDGGVDMKVEADRQQQAEQNLAQAMDIDMDIGIDIDLPTANGPPIPPLASTTALEPLNSFAEEQNQEQLINPIPTSTSTSTSTLDETLSLHEGPLSPTLSLGQDENELELEIEVEEEGSEPDHVSGVAPAAVQEGMGKGREKRKKSQTPVDLIVDVKKEVPLVMMTPSKQRAMKTGTEIETEAEAAAMAVLSSVVAVGSVVREEGQMNEEVMEMEMDVVVEMEMEMAI